MKGTGFLLLEWEFKEMPKNEVTWTYIRGGDFSRKLSLIQIQIIMEIFIEMHIFMARQTCTCISLLCQMRGTASDNEHTQHLISNTRLQRKEPWRKGSRQKMQLWICRPTQVSMHIYISMFCHLRGPKKDDNTMVTSSGF